jgi:predicted kinase
VPPRRRRTRRRRRGPAPDKAICSDAAWDFLVLIVMSGLPGVGKSTLADELGRRLPACVVSVDPAEDAMLRAGLPQSFETGVAAYEVCGTFAARQLTLGFNVVADAANYLEIARDTWRRAASSARTALRVVHVICSDEDAHRRRLAFRQRGLSHYPEPTWSDVERRRSETEPWSEHHLVIDSCQHLDANVRTCLSYVVS